MGVKERIFHMVLFEAIALSVMVPLGTVITEHGTGAMTGTLVVLAVIAMVWNYIYNLGFDHLFGHKRMNRTWKMRVFHTLAFEAGLIVFTLPLIMWLLNMGFWEALVLDLGVILFFLIYSFVYNWCYDHAREVLFRHKNLGV
ncbi:PACE efflux transporter [Candidatus Sororendozoicomonas aggregata]|uniref:PACE efflux transporter n=1 Tax=Candidatus Sororendozoicomonas aggregata TaxID=3073239 RepID=UPI002ED01BDC